MKNSKKLLAMGLVALSVASVAATSALAAPRYNFDSWVSGNTNFTTWDMKKDNDGSGTYGYYGVNFVGSDVSKQIRLHTQLRSGNTFLGSKNVLKGNGNEWTANKGKKGQNVHLLGTRENFFDGKAKVWGSWSSDRT